MLSFHPESCLPLLLLFVGEMSLNFLLRKFPTSLIASNSSIRLSKSFPINQTTKLRCCRPYTVTMAKNDKNDKKDTSDTSKHNNKDGHEHTEKDKAGAADEAHQFQSGATTHRKEDEWKHRAPYTVHKDDADFDTKWKGGCHCGKVKYELSREKPLATKFCHCSTCQRLHGVSWNHSTGHKILTSSGTIPMGGYLPQGRYQLHSRSPRPWLV